MRETIFSILLIGSVILPPLAISLAVVAGSETSSFAINAGEREHVPPWEEEAYFEYE